MQPHSQIPTGLVRRLQTFVDGIPPEQKYDGKGLKHVKYLLDEMESGRLVGAKAHRALGWVQCSLAHIGVTNLADERVANSIFFSEEIVG